MIGPSGGLVGSAERLIGPSGGLVGSSKSMIGPSAAAGLVGSSNTNSLIG